MKYEEEQHQSSHTTKLSNKYEEEEDEKEKVLMFTSAGEVPQGNIEVPPDGGWGWLVVAGATSCLMLLATVAPCFGVLFGERLKEMGASPSMVAWMLNSQFMMWNIGGPLCRPLSRRWGYRRTAFVGAFCVSTFFFTAILIDSPIVLLFTFAILTGAGGGLAVNCSLFLTAQYFEDRLGVANGIAQTGASLGMMLIPQLSYILQTNFDFTWATLIMGAITLNAAVGTLFYHPVEMHLKSIPSPKTNCNLDSNHETDNQNIESLSYQSLTSISSNKDLHMRYSSKTPENYEKVHALNSTKESEHMLNERKTSDSYSDSRNDSDHRATSRKSSDQITISRKSSDQITNSRRSSYQSSILIRDTSLLDEIKEDLPQALNSRKKYNNIKVQRNRTVSLNINESTIKRGPNTSHLLMSSIAYSGSISSSMALGGSKLSISNVWGSNMLESSFTLASVPEQESNKSRNKADDKEKRPWTTFSSILSRIYDGDPCHLFVAFIACISTTTSLNALALVPLMVGEAGYSMHDGATAMSVAAGADMASRILFALIADQPWTNIRLMYNVGQVLQVVVLLVLTISWSQWWLILACMAVQGVCLALLLSIEIVMMVRVVGTENLQSVYSVSQIFKALSFITVGPIGGILRSITGNYSVTLVFFSSLQGLGLLLAFIHVSCHSRYRQ